MKLLLKLKSIQYLHNEVHENFYEQALVHGSSIVSDFSDEFQIVVTENLFRVIIRHGATIVSEYVGKSDQYISLF